MRIPHSKQRGSMLAPFLLSLGAIVLVSGTIIESTLMLHARGRLFDGAENALLAAANQTEYFIADTLDQDAVNAFAAQYYAKNMLDPATTSLDYTKIAENELIIHSTKKVPLFFLPASHELSVDLAASVSLIAGTVEGLAPIAVLETDFVEGGEYTLKSGAPGGGSSSIDNSGKPAAATTHVVRILKRIFGVAEAAAAPPASPPGQSDDGEGNYGALDLDGSGANGFEDVLVNGYDKGVSVGGTLTTEPGVKAGPTESGITTRLANGQHVILVVITDAFPNGKGEINVKGFAAFYVESAEYVDAGNGTVIGKFINYKVEALPAEPGAPDYGVYTQPKLKFYSES